MLVKSMKKNDYLDNFLFGKLANETCKKKKKKIFVTNYWILLNSKTKYCWISFLKKKEEVFKKNIFYDEICGFYSFECSHTKENVHY